VGGNLVTDGGGSFGADGGFVKSIAVDGTIYTYDPATGGSISFSGGPNRGVFHTATNTLEVALLSGGSIAVDMDNGAYNYTPPETIDEAFTEVFAFTLTDTENDVASSTLTINVTDDASALGLVARDDRVITNEEATVGLDVIVIPDFALLYNDSADGPVSITGTNGGTGGSSAHIGTDVRFTEATSGEQDGGSFTYMASTSSISDIALVTIDRSQAGSNTLNGTANGDILIGRGVADTINGSDGNDVVFGQAGADLINGGNGDDHLRGGSGNDTINGGEGADYLLGANGSDVLSGDAGADILDGGLGPDTMTGGAGDDVFVVDASSLTVTADDLIADYQAGDVIDLSAIFGSIGGANAGNVDSMVNLQQSGANTAVMVDSDGAGAGTAFVQVAVVAGNAASIAVLYDAAAPPAPVT
jgi:Ca2+-binding RTX toxin-like protein